VAYQTIQENIRTQFGNRFLVVFQIGAANQPFFALVPNPEVQGSRQQQRPLTRPFLALGLLLTTLLTTTLVGVEMAKEELTRDMFAQNPTLLFLGLPYAIALIVILGTHELGHYLTARYYRIKATLPYFIPIPFALGTFGAFIQMRSPVPNRKALFDVGIAGPIAGFVVTLPLIIWGLMHSEVVPLPDKPDLSALSPNLSILFALLSKITLGANLTLNDGIQLHPVAVAGCLGLVITALNLMPVGQLDGGHIVHAMYGQRTGSIIGQVSRILVLLLALSIQPLLRFWAIILLFIPATDEPALNDVSELNSSRDLLGLAALGILLLIVLPVPHSFTHLLFATNPVP
jgi:membrane-associated protease RseP (regulator of RpoE activity)